MKTLTPLLSPLDLAIHFQPPHHHSCLIFIPIVKVNQPVTVAITGVSEEVQ